MTDTLTWPDVRAQATEKFRGQTPRPQDEQTVVDHFERSPLKVLRAIDEVSAAQVTWFWSALAARLERAGVGEGVSVSVGPSREQLVARAEAWLRNCGAHFDRWSEVEDELFGDRGVLRGFADDGTRSRLRGVWETTQRAAA